MRSRSGLGTLVAKGIGEGVPIVSLTVLGELVGAQVFGGPFGS